LVLVLEELYKDKLGDLGAQVSDEDAELGTTLIAASVSQTTTRGPVQLEWAVGVGDQLTVESKGLGRGIRAREVDEAISSIAAMR
jgi:hypothetical protein